MAMKMKVVVQNLTGTLFYVQLGNDATVGDLKREIETLHNLPCDRLILVPDSHRCPLMTTDKEGTLLVDCGVQDGSHIYLFLNPLDDDSCNHFVFTLPDFLLG